MELQFLTEEQIKVQLTLDDDVFEAQKAIIELDAQAAEEDALQFIGRPLDEVIDIWGKVPKNIILACLHRITDSYTHRDPNQIISRKDVVAPIPAAQWQDMLKPYIKPDTL